MLEIPHKTQKDDYYSRRPFQLSHINSPPLMNLYEKLKNQDLSLWLIFYIFEVTGINPSSNLCEKVDAIWEHSKKEPDQKVNYYTSVHRSFFRNLHTHLGVSIQLRYNASSIFNIGWDGYESLYKEFKTLLNNVSDCEATLLSISKSLCPLQMVKLFGKLQVLNTEDFSPSVLLSHAKKVMESFPFDNPLPTSIFIDSNPQNSHLNKSWIFDKAKLEKIKPYLLGYSIGSLNK